MILPRQISTILEYFDFARVSGRVRLSNDGYAVCITTAACLVLCLKQGTTFLFLSFRCVLNVICSFLGNSPASEF